jgi:hypothetical protein
MLLPAFVALVGIIGALVLVGGLPRRIPGPGLSDDDVTDWIPVCDEGYDDDYYVEYVVSREPDRYRASYPPLPVEDDETEQIVWRRPEPEPEPIGFAHNGFQVAEDHFTALDSVRPAFAEVFADDDEPATVVDDFSLWTVSESGRAAEPESPSRHRLGDESEPRRARHHRDESDDAETYGRHSLRRG